MKRDFKGREESRTRCCGKVLSLLASTEVSASSLELNCETDFAAAMVVRTLGDKILAHIAATNWRSRCAFLDLGGKVSDLVTKTATIGEKRSRFAVSSAGESAGRIVIYIHMSGIESLVDLPAAMKPRQRDVAMHIAASTTGKSTCAIPMPPSSMKRKFFGQALG